MSDSNTPNTKANAPTHTAYQVSDGKDKGYWTRIGAAWAHKDGKGFSIQLECKDTTSANPTFLPDSCGSSDSAAKCLISILGEKGDFENPKPPELIKHLLALKDKDALILDSFAGSGTTAHAVLALNKEDGGNRKFILVEMEDYADTTTAERVRRVINGVPTAKDETLKRGLGGSFTFCELGKEISIEKILTGDVLPAYDALAKYVFYTATGKSLDKDVKEKPDYFVGETDLYEVYLVYKPDMAFLRSNDSALNAVKLEAIAGRKSKKEKLVFATAKYMGQKELSQQNITFCQLYALSKKITAKISRKYMRRASMSSGMTG